MRGRRRHRKIWKRLAAGAAGLVILLVLAATVAWMAFQHIPSWYVPLEVSRADLSRVRNSLPNTYQELSDQIIKGEPFDFTLSEQAVTEWIVARGELYPDARDWLPTWIRDPVVSFEDDHCIVGGRIIYDDWQTIVGIHLVADISEETVTIRADRFTTGALPVPLSQLSELLERLLHDQRLDVEAMPDPAAAIVGRLRSTGPTDLMAHGVSWPNLFQTRNGKRLIKIRSATASNGQLRVRIEPQPRASRSRQARP